MSNVYESYKPLRNMMRQCNLAASLVDVWQLSQHLMNNGTAPVQPGMPPYSVKQYLFSWDLPTIAREVVLHADHKGKKRLNSLVSMQTVINTIRCVEDASSKELLATTDVMQGLHRISHRQFPWQQKSDLVGLLRYLKIFGSPEVGPILECATGFSIRDYFLLGIWLTGHFQTHFDVNADKDFTSVGIPRDRSLEFFLSLSSTANEIRDVMKGRQRYDDTWEYTWNQLEATPLIAVNPTNRYHLYCPVPELLLRRFSHGIYYDLCRETGFDKAFGFSFQNYVGEILRAVFNQTCFTVFEEKEYEIAKGLRHHGADWILSGTDANLFIECKTKRMKLAAKVSMGGTDLAGEIGIIADAVVQLYKNIQEAVAGKSNWIPNGLPNFPLVVTLEDWFIFGPLPQNLLLEAVTDRMCKAGIDFAMLETMPYAVASAREFERFTGVIKEIGIQTFFARKREADYSQWMWEEYAKKLFPTAKRTNLLTLFQNDWNCIIPTQTVSDA